jgi:hypothetical protein
MTNVPPEMKEYMTVNHLGRPRGNPEQVRKMLQPCLDMNLDMMIARVSWARFDLERSMKSAEVFAREVMPMLKEGRVSP